MAIFGFPLTSWALGRWYQGRLIAALDVKEKQQGKLMQNESVLSTSSPNDKLQRTFIHVAPCQYLRWTLQQVRCSSCGSRVFRRSASFIRRLCWILDGEKCFNGFISKRMNLIALPSSTSNRDLCYFLRKESKQQDLVRRILGLCYRLRQ